MSLKIKFIPAHGGDCIFLSHTHEDKQYHILIDGGTAKTYHKIKQELDENKRLDLLIVTHIDNDHIGGIKAMLEDPEFDYSKLGDVWINHSELVELQTNNNNNISIQQLVNVKQKLEANGKTLTTIVNSCEPLTLGELKITVLSPSREKQNIIAEDIKTHEPDSLIHSNKDDHQTPLKDFDISLFEPSKFTEDKSKTNGSSIAILLEYQNKNFLFAADAHPTVLVQKLQQLGYCDAEPIPLELFKISHHGSQQNTNNELLGLVSCSNFFFCANGSSGLPNKATLAAILRYPNRNIKEKINFYFPEETEKLKRILNADDKKIETELNFSVNFQTDFNYE